MTENALTRYVRYSRARIIDSWSKKQQTIDSNSPKTVAYECNSTKIATVLTALYLREVNDCISNTFYDIVDGVLYMKFELNYEKERIIKLINRLQKSKNAGEIDTDSRNRLLFSPSK